MKYRIILAAVSMVLVMPALHAQEYTVEELRQGFFEQYVERMSRKENSTAELDMLFHGNSRNIWDKDSTNCFLYHAETLRDAGKIHLPPSKYVVIEEELYSEVAHHIYWYSTNDTAGSLYSAREIPETRKNGKVRYAYKKEDENNPGFAYRLYWKSIRDTSNTELDKELRNALCKIYGCLTLDDGTVLIPAKWFSGEILAAFDPFVFGNTLVTDHLQKGQVKNGEFSLTRMSPYTDEYWYFSCKIIHDVRDIGRTPHKEGIKVAYFGTPNAKERERLYREGLTLFARDINRCLDESTLPESIEGEYREYDVMLYLDEKNKAHLYPLLPRELTNEDRILLSSLSNAVEQQPAGTFGKLLSARGPFPALYFRVSFSHKKWHRFCDFRFIQQSDNNE